jgi:hypothetical protein
MNLLKVSGKMLVSDNAKVKVTNEPSFDETSIWSFSQPSGSLAISGFSVGFSAGSVIVNFESGSQLLQSNQPININI